MVSHDPGSPEDTQNLETLTPPLPGMADFASKAAPFETPGDDAEKPMSSDLPRKRGRPKGSSYKPLTAEDRGLVTRRGTRYRVFADGDVRAFIAMAENNPEGLPEGTLSPVPEAPGFMEIQSAMAWLRQRGTQLAGRRVVLAKIARVIDVEVEAIPATKLVERPRTPMKNPSL